MDSSVLVTVPSFDWVTVFSVDLTVPSLLTLAAMVIIVVLLGMSMKSLPVGTAYAVWVGVGAVGTAILGIVLFAEPATAGRLISLGLIVLGIVGLKLATPG